MIKAGGTTRLEYKYVITRESDGQAKQWEPFDGNRVVESVSSALPQGAGIRDVIVEDQYGQQAHIKE